MFKINDQVKYIGGPDHLEMGSPLGTIVEVHKESHGIPIYKIKFKGGATRWSYESQLQKGG